MKVIHGYPMRFNAGSEVYSQTLCRQLVKRNEVHVFTRELDPFRPDYSMKRGNDTDCPEIKLHLINMSRSRDRYRHREVDLQFDALLAELAPEVVHIGHTNHLSTSLVEQAANRKIPVVFTLHDYWLMCPRGQFIQIHPRAPQNMWTLCSGQDDQKCAERCYAPRYASGIENEYAQDVSYWRDWTARRMRHVREMVELVDLFIAPSRTIYSKFHDEFGLPESKLMYLDYGFDLGHFPERQRTGGEPFTFGYIGTHVPVKGIQDLMTAFSRLKGGSRLRIWGRDRAETTPALKLYAEMLSTDTASRIEWMPEYRNREIVRDVFDRVDAIVVPSIWIENSPLVIHEAQQARVPVITADMGGMSEYVHHEKNGLLFAPRNPDALAAQMHRFIENPGWARSLGERGYLFSESGDVPDIEAHALEMEKIYCRAITDRNDAEVNTLPAPWRITFDTNPDHCNYRCTMCEEHSPYSELQFTRRVNGTPKRVMPFELMERNIRALAAGGVREVIPSTMGEPLLYKDFEKIIKLCNETGVMLNLTTNGSFPKLGACEWAKRLVPVTSDIKISWNGACKKTQEKIMQNANWENMIANAKNFITVRDTHAQGGGNRCRVTFQMTFMETNAGELPDIIRLAAALGVDRVKGHHLWAHFDKIKNEDMRRDAKTIARWNDIVVESRRVARTCPLPNGRHVVLENITEITTGRDEWATGGKCPFLGREAWVSAQGDFNPCCAPDAERKTLGIFGSLHDTDLLDIWHGEKYQSLVRTYRSRAVCQKCNMRKT